MNTAVNNLKSNMTQVSSRATVATSSIKDMSGKSGALTGAVKGIGAAVAGAFAVQKIVEFGKAIVDAAGSAQAMEAQFSQTFGEMEPIAQTAIDTMADKFGMVSNRLKPSMSQMTSMFKGLGLDTEAAMGKATDAVTLSADAAAFYDKSYADANSSLVSFVKGNYEGGESIGLFANDTQMANYAISKGLVGATSEWSALDEATKQATRLEYAQNMQGLAGATGQAAREQDGLENQLGNVKQAWQDFLAIVGGPVLGVAVDGLKGITTLLQGAGDGFKTLTEKAGKLDFSGIAAELAPFATEFEYIKMAAVGAFEQAKTKVAQAMPGIIDAAQPIMTAFTSLWEGIKPVFLYLEQTISQYVIPAISSLFNAFMDNLPAIMNFMTPLIQVLTNVISFVGNVVGFVVAIIRGDWSAAWEFAGAAVTNIVNTIGSIFNYFGNLIGIVFQFIVDSATNAWNGLAGAWNAAVGFFGDIVSGIGDVFSGVSGMITGAFDGAMSFMSELPGKFLKWGADMVQGLIDGIRGAIDKVGDAVKAVADKISSFLHFSRPDVGPLHYYETWMPDMMHGLASGITGNIGLIKNAVSGVAAEMSMPIQGEVVNTGNDANTETSRSTSSLETTPRGNARYSGSSAPITFKTEIHISVGNGADVNEIVDSAADAWEAKMERYIKKLYLRNPAVTA